MKGMTWNHPRGYEPLVAASALWAEKTGVAIEWDRRSLQDFENYPVEELARRYDLVVIDHPHVGEIAESGCLVPLDMIVHQHVLDGIAAGSVGGSFASYSWAGQQWALPIDAAAQVAAFVPERLTTPPPAIGDVAALIAAGQAALPLRPPHDLMSLFTLCGLVGVVLDPQANDLFPPEATPAYDLLRRFAAALPPQMFDMDPIAVLEEMAKPESRLAYAPLVYGYVNYAVDGFRATPIRFHDLPSAGAGPRGSVLGGTGIAVSSRSAAVEEAVAFAAFVAGGAAQRTIVAPHGGQPAHLDAWEDDRVNAASHDFYRATRKTLDRAWLRPRHRGYMAFQNEASLRLCALLREGVAAERAFAMLNELYRATRKAGEEGR